MVSLIRRFLRSLQGLLPAESNGLTILGYHLVGAGIDSVIDLPASRFTRQMTELSRHAKVLRLGEAVEEMSGNPAADGHRVVLTFDDGYENFYYRVWPVLNELGIPATIYVQVGFVTREYRGPITASRALTPLSWSQLQELVDGKLVEVGSHTFSHSDLRKVSDDQLRYELEASKKTLEDRLGVAVDNFCYPRGQWSRRVEEQVVRYYKTAVIRGGRTTPPGRVSPYRLQRVPVRSDMYGSITSVLESPVWLEEWAAAQFRKLAS